MNTVLPGCSKQMPHIQPANNSALNTFLKEHFLMTREHSLGNIPMDVLDLTIITVCAAESKCVLWTPLYLAGVARHELLRQKT